MRVLRKSRKRLKTGDIFVFQMPDELYRYGRVICTDANSGFDTKDLLIYVYGVTSKMKTPVPPLDKNQLLVRPLFTYRIAWSDGYFETVEHRPLTMGDRFPVHCFRFSAHMYERYFDEYHNDLPGRIEPCGESGLTTPMGIDNAISKALGMLLSPPASEGLIEKPRRLYKDRLAELLGKGVPTEIAEVEALKAAFRYSGHNVGDYAWPATSKTMSKVPHYVLSPPNPKYLCGEVYYIYQDALSAALRESMSRERAEIEAMKATVKQVGDRVEDYAWPEAKSRKRSKRKKKGSKANS